MDDLVMEEYLLLVKEKMQKYFHIKAGYLDNFVSLEKGNIKDKIRPLLVINFARMFGEVNEKVISLAAVVQYIYVAFSIHKGVLENEKADLIIDSKNAFQFPILVGDYICGCFFLTLCRSDLVEYLEPLAEILCHINQGSLIRLMGEENSSEFEQDLKVVNKEVASLLAGCCWLGSKLVGAKEKEQKLAADLGLNLGIALGLAELDYSEDSLADYWKKVDKSLMLLPKGESQQFLKGWFKKLANQKIVLESLNGEMFDYGGNSQAI